MKKLFTLSFFSMLIAISLQAQRAPLSNITRNVVVVEIGTGTWCTYCPGAAMGADDLVENGHPVAIVENHNGDTYANNYSNTRNSFYNITGYPTANFDGGSPVVGGSHTESMYSSYVPKVNARMSVLTPFDIDLSFTSNGSNNYTATVDISKVGDYSSNVVLHFFITESDIQVNWQGQTELNFVNRLMVPDQNGTPLDFSAGNDLVKELSFDLDPSWVRDNCEIVVAIQDMSTKQILNGAMVPMLQPEYENDAVLTGILFPTEQACDGLLSPRLEIKNYGSEHLTSADIEYTINGGEMSVYHWTGDLAFTQTETVVLDPVEYTGQTTNTLEIDIVNPNGVAEENPGDNSADSEFGTAQETSTAISMQLFVGSSMSFQISWACLNGNGEVIAEGSGYSNNTLVDIDLPIETTDCYDFFLYDSGGNGFSGGGFLKLYDDGEIFAYVSDDLTDMVNITFHADLGIGMNEIANEEVNVYPNPTYATANVSYILKEKSDVQIEVYSITGSLVFEIPSSTQNVGEQNIQINTTQLEEGVYFVNLIINDQITTKKITVLK